MLHVAMVVGDALRVFKLFFQWEGIIIVGLISTCNINTISQFKSKLEATFIPS